MLPASDLAALREIEASQIRLFQHFMQFPDLRETIMAELVALKRREDDIRQAAPYVPPPSKTRKQPGKRHSAGRLRYFQKGRY